MFFAAPIVIMAVYSLMPLDSAGKLGPFSLDGYRAFLGESAYTAALWNSIVTTLIVVVASTLVALATYPSGVHLIAGGRNKRQDFSLLAPLVADAENTACF